MLHGRKAVISIRKADFPIYVRRLTEAPHSCQNFASCHKLSQFGRYVYGRLWESAGEESMPEAFYFNSLVIWSE
jgi:hypothetical protein